MPNEPAGGGGDADDGIDITATHRVDYPRLFATHIGLAISESGRHAKEIGDRVATTGKDLPRVGDGRRRAQLTVIDADIAAAIAEFTTIVDSLEDARNVVREQYQQFSERKESAP